MDPKDAAQGQAGKQDPSPAAGAPAENQGAAPQGAPAPQGEGEKMVPLAALQEARDSIRDLKTQMELLQSFNPDPQSHQRMPDPGFGQQHQHQQQPPQHQQLEELWQTDPRRAMQSEISMALNWYDRTNSNLDVQEEQVAQKHTDFDKYRGSVRQYLRSLAPEQRTKQGVVEMAYYLAKGQKADDLVNMSREDLIAKIRAGEEVQGFTGGGMPSAPLAPAAGKPTQDQMKAAQAMGMSVEDYMKHVR